ncbi:hypothetical protein C0081_04250 [Cohaesibacter celericrescens]|uniref:Uncharacterized protein n=1 Tax=Cohaesibacter celericrescens TaxID=2067669 RepID=A0A2N5XVC9_9HYPH|nr:hypothetical protein C0081_04250 [Cohaesibacter celericrescens]
MTVSKHLTAVSRRQHQTEITTEICDLSECHLQKNVDVYHPLIPENKQSIEFALIVINLSMVLQPYIWCILTAIGGSNK